MHNAAADPPDFSSYHGRLIDVDSHLQLAVRQYPEILGEPGEELLARYGGHPELDPDGEEAMTAENVWNVKGAQAPGATSVAGRIEALDLMGIERQMVFPQVIVCFLVWGKDPRACQTMRRYNDYVLEWTRAGQGRIRPCAILRSQDEAELLAEAKRVVEAGARSVLVQDSRPMGGLSPADPALDPLWALLAEADVPVLLHIGGQQAFTASSVWGDLPALRTEGIGSGEPVNTHYMAGLHMSPQNFIQTLVLGGVFERHPGLRLGAIELGAHRYGPMAEWMDRLIAMPFSKKVRSALSLKPSEYLRRNTRVTPFLMDDPAILIDRHGMEEVYAFSTDFPHAEGGRNPIGRMGTNLARHGEGMLQRFFVENGELLLPA